MQHMRYMSTRGGVAPVTAEEAIVSGLAPDGGLFTPEKIPPLKISPGMAELPYAKRAAAVMSPFLEGWDAHELEQMASKAYSPDKFGGPSPAPVKKLGDSAFLLELWHGPTCAFKDMALQFLPRLLTRSLKLTGETRRACILTATSGDTGKAALEGFRDVENTCIMVFYPSEGVSDIQKLQMTTQQGSNVSVSGVIGNFDDSQTGVKAIFSNPAMREYANASSCFFSSANSINWGRVLPQIVYYFSAYLDLVSSGDVEPGRPINVCVPTGNFGNILSAYIAREMGVPISRLVCASNRNDVLTRFISTGVYDRRREFHGTLSPSMDILISSNLERMLFLLSGLDSDFVSSAMSRLARDGVYDIPDGVRPALRDIYYGGSCDDTRTMSVINKTFRERGVLVDPHTAVGLGVFEDFRRETTDNAPTLVVSTASPYKFCGAVISALGGHPGDDPITALEQMTGTDAPEALKQLHGRKERFPGSVEKTDMAQAVRKWLDSM